MEHLLQHLETTLSQLPLADALRHMGDHLGEYAFYALIANFLLATILHKLGHLTIFRDDKDATVTNLSPGLVIALYFLFQSAGMAPDWKWYLTGASLLVYFALVAQITYSANRNPMYFLSAYLAKLTGVVVFYLAVFIALFFILKKVFGATRSERREAAQIAGLASMAGGLLYWWARKVTGSQQGVNSQARPAHPRPSLQRPEEGNA